MNEHEERRVIEALQALTGGLTVTEHDIVTAGGRLNDRLQPPSPRRRLPLLVAAAAAALVLVGYVVFQAIDRDGNAAPPANRLRHTSANHLRAALQADAYTGPDTDFTAGARPTSRGLAGVWLLRPPYRILMFVDGNGDWGMDSPTGSAAFGTTALARGTLTRRIDDRSDCARSNHLVGYSTSWRTALAQDGSLRLQLRKPPGVCTPADDREVWDRVAPGSPIASYLLTTAQSARWHAAPSGFVWGGTYVAPETGHVLDVSKDGRYRYYGSLTARTLVAADRGRLESLPGEVRGSCAAGSFSGSLEVVRLPGVNGYISAYDAIRITTAEDGCTSIAAQDIWVDLST